jgi:hypothetical protein
VTAGAGKKSDEGNTIVAHSTILAAKDFTHIDRISSCKRQKWDWVAVAAIQPKCVRAVWKQHVGHFFGVLHDNIKVKCRHG